MNIIKKFIIANAPFIGIIRPIYAKLKDIKQTRYLKGQGKKELDILIKAAETGGDIFRLRCKQELDLLYKLNIKRYNISAYLDVGANIGQNTISSRAYFNDDIPIYAFEPGKETYQKLLENCKGYSNIFCYNIGIGEKTEEKTFFRCLSSTTSQASTFLEYSNLYKEEYPQQVNTEQKTCQVNTLNDFFSKKRPLGDNVFLHADVEGYEYHVLKGSIEILPKVKVLILEISYGLFENEGSFGQIFDFLRDRFRFAGFIDPLIVSKEGDSLYQDCLFIRKD